MCCKMTVQRRLLRSTHGDTGENSATCSLRLLCFILQPSAPPPPCEKSLPTSVCEAHSHFGLCTASPGDWRAEADHVMCAACTVLIEDHRWRYRACAQHQKTRGPPQQGLTGSGLIKISASALLPAHAHYQEKRCGGDVHAQHQTEHRSLHSNCWRRGSTTCTALKIVRYHLCWCRAGAR